MQKMACCPNTCFLVFLLFFPCACRGGNYLRREESSSSSSSSSSLGKDATFAITPDRNGDRSLLQSTIANIFHSTNDAPQPRQRPVPRDLYIDDETGMVFTKSRENNTVNTNDDEIFSFVPYGNSQNRQLEQQHDEMDTIEQENRNLASDTMQPTIVAVYPGNGATVSSVFEVRATVTDNMKVKRVIAKFVTSTGTTYQFSLSSTAKSVWSKQFQLSRTISLKMTIIASDAAGNSKASTPVTFTAASSTSTQLRAIANDQWTSRSALISRASGRIVFDMIDSSGVWQSYVCSGTLVQLASTSTTPRSIVMTAAHCIFDDTTKKFARNAIFIPQQDDGGMDQTDRDCTNDALGCLTLHYGLVSDEWASRSFPNNAGVDYGFYVSKSTKTNAKGKTIGVSGDIKPMLADFGPVTPGTGTYAMGYSYDDDPRFMYSYDKLGYQAQGQLPNLWLPSSLLNRGASGGPWVQDNPSSGVVGIIGVNSWGSNTHSGMASSPMNTGGASCVFDAANMVDLSSIAGNGQVVNCPQ